MHKLRVITYLRGLMLVLCQKRKIFFLPGLSKKLIVREWAGEFRKLRFMLFLPKVRIGHFNYQKAFYDDNL